MAQRRDAFPELQRQQSAMDRAAGLVVSPMQSGRMCQGPCVAHQRCEVLPDVVRSAPLTRGLPRPTIDDCFDPPASASLRRSESSLASSQRHGQVDAEAKRDPERCSVGAEPRSSRRHDPAVNESPSRSMGLRRFQSQGCQACGRNASGGRGAGPPRRISVDRAVTGHFV